MTDHYPKMTKLCATFPALVGLPGTSPFDAEALHQHATSPAATSGSVAATAFVLSVFNATHWRALLPFDVVHALSIWDTEHRAAFLAWATAPWTA
jgi:hypothetical protein